MNRRNAGRAALIALPLFAFILYAAVNWYTIVDEEINVGAREAALENPYLAFARLLDRMGTPARAAERPSALDELPARATLVLASRRLAYMSPDRVNRIRNWVDRGGALVVEAEREGIDDPLLDALGVQRIYPARDANGQRRNMADARRFTGAAAIVTVDWPQLGKPLRARIAPGVGSLRDARVRSDVSEARAGDRVVALAFSSGEGRVTVLPTFNFLRNDQIGALDHAELGWRLAAPQQPIVTYLRMQALPLLEWVTRDAWPVALAAMVLIALWLARIIPRFGPLAPDAPPVRRSLIDHVVASGRFLWSRNAGGHLVEAVRERALRTARVRGVPVQRMPPELKSAAISSRDAAAFTQRIATLQKVEERLSKKEGRK